MLCLGIMIPKIVPPPCLIGTDAHVGIEGRCKQVIDFLLPAVSLEHQTATGHSQP